jgi:hypothetical protein
LSGDAYKGGRVRALRLGHDVHQIIASLLKLVQLPVMAIFTGSGTVRESGTKLLLDKTACLESVGALVSELHGQGFVHRQIRRRPLGREPPVAYITVGNLSGLRPVRSCLTNSAVGDPPADRRGELQLPPSASSRTGALRVDRCSQATPPARPTVEVRDGCGLGTALARGCVSWTSYVKPVPDPLDKVVSLLYTVTANDGLPIQPWCRST